MNTPPPPATTTSSARSPSSSSTSPFNQRMAWPALDELAASIRAEGRIHEPCSCARASPTSCGRTSDGFEIVFGHRRARAAEQAGLATAPCMVRALTDAEARSA